jgi:hypothetical protein
MRTAGLAFAAVVCVAPALSADPLTCNRSGYKAVPGLAAAVLDNTLAVVWDGEKNQVAQAPRRHPLRASRINRGRGSQKR